jgi:hypothetical protein
MMLGRLQDLPGPAADRQDPRRDRPLPGAAGERGSLRIRREAARLTIPSLRSSRPVMRDADTRVDLHTDDTERRVRVRSKPRQQSRYVIMLPASSPSCAESSTDNSAARCSNSEGGNTRLGEGMHLAGGWQPPGGDPVHPRPVDPGFWLRRRSALCQCLVAEGPHCPGVAGHGVVGHVPAHHAGQPAALCRNG